MDQTRAADAALATMRAGPAVVAIFDVAEKRMVLRFLWSVRAAARAVRIVAAPAFFEIRRRLLQG